jgi:hypothetical protein
VFKKQKEFVRTFGERDQGQHADHDLQQEYNNLMTLPQEGLRWHGATGFENVPRMSNQAGVPGQIAEVWIGQQRIWQG